MPEPVAFGPSLLANAGFIPRLATVTQGLCWDISLLVLCGVRIDVGADMTKVFYLAWHTLICFDLFGEVGGLFILASMS
jgi:hypothetical protein